MASNTKMLRVTPCETLKFLECNNNEVGIHLTCKHHYPLMYKIQTTSPEKFRVRPRAGILEPKETIHISILLKPEYELNENPREKFLVLAAMAPMDEDLSTPQSIADFWKRKYGNLNCVGVEQHRLTCSYGSKQQRQQQLEQEHQIEQQQQHHMHQQQMPLMQQIQQQVEQQLQIHLQQQTFKEEQLQEQPEQQDQQFQQEYQYPEQQELQPPQIQPPQIQSQQLQPQQPQPPLNVPNVPSLVSEPLSETESEGQLCELHFHASQMEKQLRLTQALQYLTLFVLLVVSVAVVFLLRFEAKASRMASASPVTIINPGPNQPYGITKKFSNTFNRFKSEPCQPQQ